MKKMILAAVLVAVSLPAKAQLFSSEALGGAVLGGIAGGVIGHNSGRHTAEGIGIGAGAGLLLGALTSNYRRDYVTADPSYSSGYYSPGYATYSPRPNYAVTGALLGGVAGGVIGHNNGRHTAEGIAIGAGAGLLLGGIAEHELRQRERLTTYAPQTVVTTVPATVLTTTPIVSQQVVVPSSQTAPAAPAEAASVPAMSGANSLFGR